MFVLLKTYNELMALFKMKDAEYQSLLKEWNALVAQINERGGKTFLENAQVQQKNALTEDDIKKLLILCHPDKHGGKNMAQEMTKKLLAIRADKK